jgi:hypothetical protein
VKSQLGARREALEVMERELQALKEGIDMAALEVCWGSGAGIWCVGV